MKAITLWAMLSCAIFTAAYGQKNAGGNPIPLDPYCRYGQLKNGFTFYIRKTTGSENIRMKLVVKAGKDHETDDQREYAHLLEHLAFVRTRHVENVKATANRWGMNFGEGLNGTTYDKFTDFIINIKKAGAMLDSSLQLLRDYAQQGIIFDPASIANERMVVLQELNMGNVSRENASLRLHAALIEPALFKGRLLADTRINLLNGSDERLRQFYEDWYRADLQALIIIGDVDVAAVEKKIRDLFSDLLPLPPSRKYTAPRPAKLPGSNQFLVYTHPQQQTTELQFFFREPWQPQRTQQDVRSMLLRQLCSNIMNRRFQDVHEHNREIFDQMPRSIYLNPQNGSGELVSGWRFDAHVKDTAVQKAFFLMLTEILRNRAVVCSAEELKAAKKAVTEGISYDSANILTNTYVEHFVFGNAAPDPVYKARMLRGMLEDITPADLLKTFKALQPAVDRAITLFAPEKYRNQLPTSITVNKWFETARQQTLTGFVYSAPQEAKPPEIPWLMRPSQADSLSASTNIRSTAIPELNMIKAELQNGVTVLIRKRPPAREENNFTLLAASKSGSASHTGQDFVHAYLATALLARSGLGNAEDKKTLHHYYKQHKINVHRDIGLWNATIKANAETVEGFEKALQCIYLYFTAPVTDTQTFSDFVSSEQQKLDVSKRFLKYSLKLPERELTSENIGKANQQQIQNIIKRHFNDISGYTIVINTNTDPSALLAVISKYLGNMKPNGWDSPAEVSATIRQKGLIVDTQSTSANTGSFSLEFRKEEPYNIRQALRAAILGNLLEMAATNHFREKEGFCYGGLASASLMMAVINSSQHDEAKAHILGLYCAGDKINEGLKRAWEIVRQLTEKGPSPEALASAKLRVRPVWDSLYRNAADESPVFWQNYLLAQTMKQGNYLDIVQYSQMIDQITADDIKNFAASLLQETNCTLTKSTPVLK